MPVDDLLVLSYLREERRLTTDAITAHLQKSDAAIRATLTRLIERGLAEAHGPSRGQGRMYTLSAMVYRAAGERAEYVRQVGFDPIQQEQMVLIFVDAHRKINRQEAMELCRLNDHQAKRLLKRLVDAGQLAMCVRVRKHSTSARKFGRARNLFRRARMTPENPGVGRWQDDENSDQGDGA